MKTPQVEEKLWITKLNASIPIPTGEGKCAINSGIQFLPEDGEIIILIVDDIWFYSSRFEEIIRVDM